MQRTILALGTLLVVSGVVAQQQSPSQPEQQPSQAAVQENASSSRDEALDNAPEEVKEQIMRHAAAQDLQELSARDVNGMTTFEALFQGENSQTTLRLAQDGSPISMHIVGNGSAINEAAGARRDTPEPKEEERAIQQLQQTQDPGETQGVPNEVRMRIQQQLGDAAVEDIKPKVFYELNVRQDGNLQQIWADDKGTLLKPQQ